MKKFIITALVLSPVLASAQSLANVNTLLQSIGNLVQLATPIVVGIALLAFFWGLVKFIFAQGNEESKADAKKIMLWGIIALFVMISVWGLVEFLRFNLGIGGQNVAVPPSVIGF